MPMDAEEPPHMRVCRHIRRISAYYDGEATPEERRFLDAHVGRCSGCMAELEGFRSLSRLLSAAGMPEAPERCAQRLHRRVGALSDQRVLRMARMLTAAAAAVIFLCGGWLWQASVMPQVQSDLSLQWETAAVTPSITSDPDAGAESSIAQWIIDDLSRENRDD